MSVARNSVYNLAGSALPMLVSLATVPAYLATIGPSRFGVLSVVWLLLGYFGLFDLGLGLATAQRIAALPEDAHADRALRFWSALFTNAGLGLLGGLILVPIAQYYFGHVLKIDEALRAELLSCVWWLAAAVPVATTSGVLTGALQGQERFAMLNSISVGSTLLFQILPLATALLISPSLAWVLPAALLTRMIGLLVLAADCWRRMLRGYPIAGDRHEARMMIGFGGWTTVSALFGPLMGAADRLAIGGVIGAREVSFYAIPYSLAERTTIVGNSVASASFPRIAALGGAEGRALALATQRFLMAVMLPVLVFGVFAIVPFLQLWVGKSFAGESAVAGAIVMAAMWSDGASRAPLYALRGYGQPRLIALVDLIQIIPYLAFLLAAIRIWGIEGAAGAYVVRSTGNYLLLSGFARTFSATIAGNLASFALLTASVFGSLLLPTWSLAWFASVAAAGVLSLAIAYAILDPVQRDRVRSLVPLRRRRAIEADAC